jgi:uncharacterized protein
MDAGERDGGRRPVGRQRWRDLLFVHWQIPAAALRPLVPAALALDAWEGRTYVTLIPFAIEGSLPAFAPRAMASSFLETNLRTYVRGPDGAPGIYFFSLEASSLAAVVGARAFYGLPYFFADMEMHRQGERIAYRSRRRLGRHGDLAIEWRVGAPRGPADAGSRDAFLVERYLLFVQRVGRLWAARVRHEPYPLCAAAVDSLSQSLMQSSGIPLPGGSPTDVHASPGVDVEIFWLRQVRVRT